MQIDVGGVPTDYVAHSDDLGNVMKLSLASTGAVVESYEYEDYGTLLDGVTLAGLPGGSAIGNPFLFSGRRWDEAVQLYEYRNRYLDPESGRFISRDPIGVWGDAGNHGNAYTYCGSNPWSFTDPMGLERGGRTVNPDPAGPFDWMWIEFNRDPAEASHHSNETRDDLQQKRKDAIARQIEEQRIENLRREIQRLEESMKRTEDLIADRAAKGLPTDEGVRVAEQTASVLNRTKQKLGEVMVDSFKDGPFSGTEWFEKFKPTTSEHQIMKNVIRHELAGAEAALQSAQDGVRFTRGWGNFFSFWAGFAPFVPDRSGGEFGNAHKAGRLIGSGYRSYRALQMLRTVFQEALKPI